MGVNIERLSLDPVDVETGEDIGRENGTERVHSGRGGQMLREVEGQAAQTEEGSVLLPCCCFSKSIHVPPSPANHVSAKFYYDTHSRLLATVQETGNRRWQLKYRVGGSGCLPEHVNIQAKAACQSFRRHHCVCCLPTSARNTQRARTALPQHYLTRTRKQRHAKRKG